MPDLTILLTRPLEGSQRFVAMIEPWVKTRADILIAPLMEVVPTGTTPDLTGFGGVIFTSANGVANAPAADLPAYCVGTRTTAMANAAGWRAECAGVCAGEMVPRLTAQRPAGPLLHLCGTHRRGNVAERLTAAGLPTRVAEVYDQRLLPLPPEAEKRLDREEPCIIPLFSPRLAGHFADVVRGRAPLHLILISAAARDEVEGMKVQSSITADIPDAEGMATSLRTLLERVEASGAAG